MKSSVMLSPECFFSPLQNVNVFLCLVRIRVVAGKEVGHYHLFHLPPFLVQDGLFTEEKWIWLRLHPTFLICCPLQYWEYEGSSDMLPLYSHINILLQKRTAGNSATRVSIPHRSPPGGSDVLTL